MVMTRDTLKKLILHRKIMFGRSIALLLLDSRTPRCKKSKLTPEFEKALTGLPSISQPFLKKINRKNYSEKLNDFIRRWPNEILENIFVLGLDKLVDIVYTLFSYGKRAKNKNDCNSGDRRRKENRRGCN